MKNREADYLGCPFGGTYDVVLSTNSDYLDNLKINPIAPAPNLGPVTRSGERTDEKHFSPWFWPDNNEDLAKVVNYRKAAFLSDPDRFLDTANDNPAVRAASEKLLELQAYYLAENFPDTYAIENDSEHGELIRNKATDDVFSIRPSSDDRHPLAISGLLGQEDICIIKQIKNGKHKLVAGFLATPTNWELSDFIGADMDKIHRNVDGYYTPVEGSKVRLKDTVDRLLDNQREYPYGQAARNNIFPETDPGIALLPGKQHKINHSKIKDDPGGRIFIRSERETLTRLPSPHDKFRVFTIKPNVIPLAEFTVERRAEMMRAIGSNAVLNEQLDALGINETTQDYLASFDTDPQTDAIYPPAK